MPRSLAMSVLLCAFATFLDDMAFFSLEWLLVLMVSFLVGQ